MNHLKKEKSPYLLQHKDNPVHWHAWGEAAFKKAKEENKPVFLSIGYSTCHWCHVMEKDSFEKQDVADVLNKHFISIKVDREERPDIDQIYMDAVVAMRGQGGWPLSAFLTSDLKPFFGGTFFWKQQFIPLLEKIASLWQVQPQALIEDSEKMMLHLKHAATPTTGDGMDESLFKKSVDIFKQSFDPVYGGFGRAPKFPRSFDLSYLLKLHERLKDQEILKMIDVTLDRMARGGMYDHLGGGFARYSTDEKWLVPHFEKMLYDNALLVLTYLEAYQATHNEMYADVARETLDYILRDMTSPEGAFYSAEDADSEGVEGKFYVWTEEELKTHLDSVEYSLFQQVYGVTQHGNFEEAGMAANILSFGDGYSWNIKKEDPLKKIQKKLFEIREKRIHPYKDDKILVEWNGLMIAALSKAYQVLRDERYLKAALKAVSFIKEKLFKEGRLLRRYRDGEARHEGFLNDYAFLIFGLLNLYECNLEPKILQWAFELQDIQDEIFWDDTNGGYFFTKANADDLILRHKEYNDGAIPSGNSVSVLNLIKRYHVTMAPVVKDKVEAIFKAASNRAAYYPPAYAMLMTGFEWWTDTMCQGDSCGWPTKRNT